MKVLVYSNCRLDPALGSGKTRIRFSEGLRALGHSVRTVAPEEFEAWRAVRGGRRFRMAYGALRHARRTLHETNYDVIELNGGEFGWLASRLRRTARRPLLVHRTDGCELLADDAKQRASARERAAGLTVATPFHHALDRASFRDVDACVTLSELDRRFLVSRGLQPAERTLAVPPGLDGEFLHVSPPAARAPRIAFLGSWISRKGVDALVPAAASVLTAWPGVTLDLLGTGADPAAVRANFPPSVRARVEVAGRLSGQAVAERLAAAAIFVLPARYEGYGMAIAEAMACGCAVVTTRTGFGADLQDGKSAILVGFDDVPALSAAISRLIANPQFCLELAAAGWNLVRSHRWCASVAAIEAAYVRWLGGPRTNPMR
ncbi:MAG TPA: glycosyltransferase family 4 protein [Opitutaceae bacterium]|nr:glycosyltransferase family 4 protein [Opitutaceae bacterium]